MLPLIYLIHRRVFFFFFHDTVVRLTPRDAGSVILLIFVALVTPYEVAFLDVRTLSPLWCVNRIIDCIFFIDLLINFNLIYFSDSSHGFVTDRKKVVARWGCARA